MRGCVRWSSDMWRAALSDISTHTLTQIIQALTHVSITWLVVGAVVQLLSCVQLSAIVRAQPMDCSTPGSSVFHYLPKFAQIYNHWVCDAVWQSHGWYLLSIIVAHGLRCNHSLAEPTPLAKPEELRWTNRCLNSKLVIGIQHLPTQSTCVQYIFNKLHSSPGAAVTNYYQPGS